MYFLYIWKASRRPLGGCLEANTRTRFDRQSNPKPTRLPQELLSRCLRWDGTRSCSSYLGMEDTCRKRENLHLIDVTAMPNSQCPLQSQSEDCTSRFLVAHHHSGLPTHTS